MALIVGRNTLALTGNVVVFRVGTQVVIMERVCFGGTEMKNWVVLFTRTGSEEELVQILKEKLSANEFLPFVPTEEAPYRSKGVVHKVRKPLFPGYVFLQTEVETKLIADNLKQALKNTKGIYSILHYGDDEKDIVLRESERLYWERLFDTDFCTAGSIGFIEGDKIQVTSGALVGLECQIKKINRHKRIAVVEMDMMGGATALVFYTAARILPLKPTEMRTSTFPSFPAKRTPSSVTRSN